YVNAKLVPISTKLVRTPVLLRNANSLTSAYFLLSLHSASPQKVAVTAYITCGTLEGYLEPDTLWEARTYWG
ncbi:hypothetical protein TNIN_452671, partial [Trichonephila inaurata madagascariensis]